MIEHNTQGRTNPGHILKFNKKKNQVISIQVCSVDGNTSCDEKFCLNKKLVQKIAHTFKAGKKH